MKHMLNLGGDQPNASISAKPTPPTRQAILERGKPRPKKLAFVIAHLGPGGAQRVAVTAANALVSRGFDIHLIVVERKPPAYSIDPRVVLHHLRDTPAKSATSSIVDRKRWFGSGRVANRVSSRALANFNEFTRMRVGPLFAAEALRRRALRLHCRRSSADISCESPVVLRLGQSLCRHNDARRRRISTDRRKS